MENKVHTMQMELANVQRERQQLHQQRKLLKCTGPCAPCACCPPSSTITPGLPVTSISSKGPVPAGAIQVNLSVYTAIKSVTFLCINIKITHFSYKSWYFNLLFSSI